MSANVGGPGVREAAFWTPCGHGTVVVDGGSLIEVRMPPFSDCSVEGPPPPTESTGADDARRWAGELEAYFKGERSTWTPDEVDLEVLGLTPFRREVYRVLLGVPAGETVTYGELATLAGRPGAARAVGTAMAENPIAVVVPCHRVVRGDGSFGRYGDDDRWKPFLLALEGGR